MSNDEWRMTNEEGTVTDLEYRRWVAIGLPFRETVAGASSVE
jgi:hypothetical protein